MNSILNFIHQNTRYLGKKRIAGLIVILALLLSSLTIINPTKRNTDVNQNTMILGHAGSGFLYPVYPFNPYPANSMTSLIKALEENKADGVEVDVQLTTDGVPVLYHDVYLESMTDATGLIEHKTAKEVVGLKYDGGFFYNLFQNEKIITLETALKQFSTYPELPYLHIDLRNHDENRHREYAAIVLKLLQRYNYPLAKISFIAPNPDFLLAFREASPESQLILDINHNIEEGIHETLQYGLAGICANGKGISPEQVAKAKQKGLQVVLFGGKSHGTIQEMLSLQPDVVQVNNLKALKEVLE